MNIPSLSVWLQGYGCFAVKVGCVVMLAVVLNHTARSAAWRRLIWQVCYLSLLLIILMDFTAMAPRLAQLTTESIKSYGSTVAPMPSRHALVSDTEILSTAENLPVAVVPETPEDSIQLSSVVANVPPTTPELDVAKHQPRVPPDPAAPVENQDNPEFLTSLDFTVLSLNLIWFIGFCVLLGRIAFIRLLALSLRRSSEPLDQQHPLCLRTRELSLQLGLRCQVTLVQCARTSSPLVLGFSKPAIGLPVGFSSDFSPAQQDAMLLHELAHIAGRDFFWFLLADLMQAALWWHPLVWWARRQLAHAAETTADDASLLVANGPGVLAECLVEFGRRLERPSVLGRLGVAGFRSGLGRRVSRLLSLREHQWKPLRSARALWIKALSTTALVSTAFGVTFVTFPQTIKPGETPMQTIHKSWKHSAAAFLLLANLAPANPADATATDSPPAVRADHMAPAHAIRGHAAHNTGSLPMLNTPDSPERRAILKKLDEIVLEQLKLDGLPLSEVLKMLNQEAIKLDPDKQGVNFILARTLPQRNSIIDPATGLPPQSVEEADLNGILIKIELPLKNLRLKDVLEIITKVADRPIRYSIEPYGVVFSFAFPDPEPLGMPGGGLGPISQNAHPVHTPRMAQSLQVRTYRIDTNQFLANIDTTFNVKVAKGGVREQILESLHSVLNKLEVQLVPNKNLFFNDRLNMLMIRAEAQDLEVIEGVIETLGGTRTQSAPRGIAPKTNVTF